MVAECDVVVVGAGPAGSSAATLLAERGWDVLLIERERFPRHKVCGEFLSPESQRSLQAMGLYESVAALSPAPMHAAKFVSRLGVPLTVPLPGEAWGVSRHALDAALAAAAERCGADLQTGKTVTGFSRTDSWVQVDLRSTTGTRSVRTRAVLVACGRHSVGTLPPSVGSSGDRAMYVGVKLHYDGIRMPAQVELYLFPGGYAGVAPVEAGRINVCLLASYDAFRRAGKSVPAMIDAAGQWNSALRRRLSAGRALPDTEVTVAPVDTMRPAAPWDRVACLGDTAVMVPPLVGDGMAMALRSAELCAPLAHEFLQGRLSCAAWREAYCSAWYAEFSQRTRIGRLLERVLFLPILSDAFIGLGRIVPPLPAYLARATRGAVD